jgi:uncharacterized protein YndB with AHSA1/START domain
MIKLVLFIVLGVVVLAGLIAAIGYMLPQGHRASRTVIHAASPVDVFAIVSDFSRFPEWRSGITRVELLPDDGQGARFREHGTEDVIAYRVESFEPPSRLVTRIDDPSLPFGGTWTIHLAAVPEGTSLTITENGEVYNPFFRFFARTVFSPYSTIDTYHADLRKRIAARAIK